MTMKEEVSKVSKKEKEKEERDIESFAAGKISSREKRKCLLAYHRGEE